MPKEVPTADLAITLGFLIVALSVVVEARGWPLRAGLFPLAAGWLLLGLVLLKLALDLCTTWSRRPELVRQGSADEEAATETELVDVLATATAAEWVSALGWMTAFFVLLWLLGALVAVPLFALVYLLVASRESPALAAGYALVCWAFIYWLFDRLLHIPLPPGILTLV